MELIRKEYQISLSNFLNFQILAASNRVLEPSPSSLMIPLEVLVKNISTKSPAWSCKIVEVLTILAKPWMEQHQKRNNRYQLPHSPHSSEPPTEPETESHHSLEKKSPSLLQNKHHPVKEQCIVNISIIKLHTCKENLHQRIIIILPIYFYRVESSSLILLMNQLLFTLHKICFILLFYAKLKGHVLWVEGESRGRFAAPSITPQGRERIEN